MLGIKSNRNAITDEYAEKLRQEASFAKYTDYINSVLININEFLADFNLKCKLLKEYDWDDDVVGIYIYRSAYSGVLRIGVNLKVIEEYANENDAEYFNIDEIAEENILTTLWHEVGHGLMEHIRRMRRQDTQNKTGIFKGKVLNDLKEIIYNEEEVVEEFGEYMAGFCYNSQLFNFLLKNAGILKYNKSGSVKITESDLRRIVSEFVKKIYF